MVDVGHENGDEREGWMMGKRNDTRPARNIFGVGLVQPCPRVVGDVFNVFKVSLTADDGLLEFSESRRRCWYDYE